MLVFFFSSRRRHTRCLSDWSSDVCSSDLKSSGDFMEGQSFAQKNVIHPARRIDIDLESRAGAAVKLINAVRRNRRRLMKFVRSEERRVGKECRSRMGTDQERK